MSEEGHGLVSEGQHPLFGNQPPSGTWTSGSGDSGSDEERLAGLLHEEGCCDVPSCRRWGSAAGHQQYYRDKARSIIARLEPEIGIANVFTAVRVLMDEMM